MSATSRFAQRGLAFGWAMIFATLFAEPQLRADDEILVTLRPLLERHCLDCHDSGEAEGGVDLGAWVDEASVLHDPDLMLRVKAAVSEYRMPPSDQELLDQEERDQFGSILESAIARFDATQPALAGMTPVRRLNRREYRNTLRDLLGIRLDEQLELPADDSAFGIDHGAECRDFRATLFR